MTRGVSSRTRQRRNALRILFEMEMNESTLLEVLEGKRQVGEEEPAPFTIDLVKGVRMNLPAIDAVISDYSEGWDIDRMPRVDRNILRMALYEIFFLEDIPAGATIDEAVELAKEFSTEDSGKFINGLLGRANRDRESGKPGLPTA